MLNGITTPFLLSVFLAQGASGGLPWWAWVLIIIVIVLLIYFLWRWFTRPKETGGSRLAQSAAPPPPAAKAPEPAASEPAAPKPVAPQPPAPVKPDDLELIEGIGPKIASVLQAAGITTFSQLAAADSSSLDKILIESGMRLADPTTWPEQAALAAAGKWEEFKTLTDQLKGGRRVEP